MRFHVRKRRQAPAVIIVALVTTLLVVGIKESANFNNIIVLVKVAVVLLFVLLILPANIGQAKKKSKFSGILSNSAGINRLSLARLALFAAATSASLLNVITATLLVRE